MECYSSRPGTVADASVAMDAVHRILTSSTAPHDVVDEIRVTTQAALLQRPGVPRCDHDRLMEVHEREPLGVPVPVVGLRDVLWNERVRQMTIYTPGHHVVGSPAPGGVLIVHDVTVPARQWICRKVAQAFAVVERVCAEPRQRSQQQGGHDSKRSQRSHAGTIPNRCGLRSDANVDVGADTHDLRGPGAGGRGGKVTTSIE